MARGISPKHGEYQINCPVGIHITRPTPTQTVYRADTLGDVNASGVLIRQGGLTFCMEVHHWNAGGGYTPCPSTTIHIRSNERYGV